MSNTQYLGGVPGGPSVAQLPSGLLATLSDTLDGAPTLHPQLTPGGGLSPLVSDPSAFGPAAGNPVQNAILAELRVISALLREQMGDTKTGFDLQIMRADEAWSTAILTGAL